MQVKSFKINKDSISPKINIISSYSINKTINKSIKLRKVIYVLNIIKNSIKTKINKPYKNYAIIKFYKL